MFFAVVIIERDIQFGSESIYDSGANSETSKRAWARHEGDFGEILPVFAIFGEFVVDEL